MIHRSRLRDRKPMALLTGTLLVVAGYSSTVQVGDLNGDQPRSASVAEGGNAALRAAPPLTGMTTTTGPGVSPSGSTPASAAATERATPRAAASKSWTPYTRPATYAVTVQRNIPLTMRDGTILSVDVHRPAAKGRFPALLTITPYGKTQLSYDFMVQRGFAYVVAEARGTGGSQGTWTAFGADEQRDGYDLVEWAARQGWSSGNVGMFGGSYMGINQLFTAQQQPPHLKALFPLVPMADMYRDVSNNGGGYNSGFMPLWQVGLVGAFSLVPPTYVADDPARAIGVIGQRATNMAQYQMPAILDPATGGAAAYDGPAYRLRSPIERIDRVRVPTFIVGGLHDIFQRGEPLLYEALRRNGVTAKLVMGDWKHLQGSGGNGLPTGLNSLVLRWFDNYLGGVDTNIRAMPDVTQWELGGDGFVVQRDWPLPGLRARALYLGSAGTLTSDKPPAASASDTMPITFTNGICSRSTNQWMAQGGLDGTPCDTDNRPNEVDALTYTTAPLASDLRVTGPIGAHLWVSTSARDVAVTVRITDVAPDGKSRERTSGWLVASMRETDPKRARMLGGEVIQPYQYYTKAKVRPVKAGEPMLLQVEVWPTNAVWKKGHSLRISITTSDAPHLTQTSQVAAQAGGTVTLLHDRRHPSRLVLPVAGRP